MRRNIENHIRDLDLEPVVLHKQVNRGNTIIEKIERCAAECDYAVVLLSPDDWGRYKDETDLRPRPRQNVILEFGLMIGKLGRENVAMVLKGDVERPSDSDGIVYILYRRGSHWKEAIRNELEKAGMLAGGRY